MLDIHILLAVLIFLFHWWVCCMLHIAFMVLHLG